jgi:MoxR-like ATPase
MTITTQERYVETELHRRVEHWLQYGVPPILILYGPPGCGKTTTMRYLLLAAQADQFPVVWLPATWGASLETMLGFWELRGGETVFVEGELLQGLTTENCVIVIDDAHTVATELQLLNGVGDVTREVTCASLGRKIAVAAGVRLALLANPPAPDLPPWERTKWELPEQMRDRARMIELKDGLPREDELAIAALHFPKSHPQEALEGMVDIVRNLRQNGVLYSYTPSVRSLVMWCQLMEQGLSLGEAYLEAVANKFLKPEEYAAAVEAFQAKFDVDPTERSASKEGSDAG